MKQALWLVTAELLMVVVCLTLGGVAHASTRNDATRIAWYLKGQADALFATRGWTVKTLTCRPRRDRWVDCRIRVAMVGHPDVCDRAFYRINGFGISQGYDSKPHPCKGAPPA